MSGWGSERLEQIVRDVGHASRRLRGVLPPPVRSFSRTAPRALVANVRAIDAETRDACTLHLSLDRPVTLAPGQFVTIAIRIDGAVHRRNYSVSSGSGTTRELAITVKRVQGGLVSTALVTHTKVGDAFELEGPHGAFVRPSDHEGPLVLVAAGSGITPILSLLRAALERDPTARLALVYGNKSEGDVIFAREIAALAQRHSSLRVQHVLEAGAAETALEGRLDEVTLARALADEPLVEHPQALFFVCGPLPVRAAARAVLAARGIAGARIVEEKYGRDGSRAIDPAPHRADFMTTDGKRTSLVLAPGETLLAGALRAGIAAPFSCSMGGCGECKMHVIEGDVASDHTSALLPGERARGLVLGCVSQATSDVVVEVRNAR